MTLNERTPRRRWWLLGGAAAAVSVVAMLLARFLLDARTPIDMVFDLTGHLLGVPAIFNLIHALPWGIGDYAKYALFAVTAVVYLGLWALAAPVLGRLRAWLQVLLATLASVLLVGLVLLPAAGLGAFGLSPNNYFYPALATHLFAAAFGAIYGLVLAWFVRRAPAAYAPSRRDALGRGGRAVLLFAVGATWLRGSLGALAHAAGLDGLWQQIVGLSPEITPTADHYVVSKNFISPAVNERRWSLKVSGMVDHPLELSLDDLKALPAVERPTTLTCISNEIGGDLIGTSLWTGVPFADILAMAGVQAGAKELILRGADNYSDSIPLDVALRDGNLIAYQQNGETLTRDHGFPARLLVPGIYGMKNVKWLVEVELTDEEYTGFWQQRGWSDEAVVETMSRIDTAQATDLGDGTVAIGGVAFAGIRGVEAVEVSTDEGASWQRATVRPAPNDLSWNVWGFEWQAAKGTHVLMVRAVDGAGVTQTSDRRSMLPDGATGWHKLRVTVS